MVRRVVRDHDSAISTKSQIVRSLILHELTEGDSTRTILHLRFRGKIAATGLKKTFLVTGGGVMDHITTAPMLSGLTERAESDYKSS